jgi:hypothetical protein
MEPEKTLSRALKEVPLLVKGWLSKTQHTARERQLDGKDLTIGIVSAILAANENRIAEFCPAAFRRLA